MKELIDSLTKNLGISATPAEGGADLVTHPFRIGRHKDCRHQTGTVSGAKSNRPISERAAKSYTSWAR